MTNHGATRFPGPIIVGWALACLSFLIPFDASPAFQRHAQDGHAAREEALTRPPSDSVPATARTGLVDSHQPAFTYDDELILQIQVEGIGGNDTIIAYGNRQAVYLPFGELSRILDLAIRVSDDGHYASGWFISADRKLVIDLRQGLLTTADGARALQPGIAIAFDGEMYLRSEAFAELLPLTAEPDLRSQRVKLVTLEPFPFEERMARDARRLAVAGRNAAPTKVSWPRVSSPYRALSLPMADVELRALSDHALGTRAEGDLRLSGDLAWMTSQIFLAGSIGDGLNAALVELGRRDPDGGLLGPLDATEFLLGDVATTSMPLGLRGAVGRGAYVANQPIDTVSVFDQIDLRGELPDGYEVELYRNDILLDSRDRAINGQYAFLQVPVDYGLNIFRIVSYGPQGQRREEVRRISVGDGRLPQGQLVYSLGAIQRSVNLLGIKGPDFAEPDRYGDGQAVANLSWGMSRAITGIAGFALFEKDEHRRWLASAGLRTGIGSLAVRADAGLSNGGARALGLGLGGKALGGAFTFSHFEYAGNFVDEVRALSGTPLSRATELDLNLSLKLAGIATGAYLPVTLRGRHLEFPDGRTQTNAGLRGSMRFSGLIASNTLDFSRTGNTIGSHHNRLLGNFDLATFNRRNTQLRGTIGYRLLPDPAVTNVSGQFDRSLDDRTVASGSAAYSLQTNDLLLGLSAMREFDRFTLALDGRHALARADYSVTLRLGFSLGRDPLRNKLFMHRPGLATGGALAARVFQDIDADGSFGPQDEPLPDVDIAAFNNVATSDAAGALLLGELGNGNRVSLQVDPSSLPDILMAPANRGIEIVPRAGHFHVIDFPVFALSEIEGMVTFSRDTSGRGVSGLVLQLRNAAGEIEHSVRTERGGYYFFEQVRPGTYEIVVDPGQAERLGICLDVIEPIVAEATGSIYSRDIEVDECGASTTAM